MYVENYEKVSQAKVGDKIIITGTELRDVKPQEVEIVEIRPESEGMDFVVSPNFKTARGTYENIVFNSSNTGEFVYADTWHFKKENDDKIKTKESYKDILNSLKSALSIAMTTQDEHDKEIYKRIYDYITERMREVDEDKWA